MIRITEQPIREADAIETVWGFTLGAIVTFSGRIRDHEGDHPIEAIRFQAYQPMAERELERIAAAAFERWGARLAILHRVGRVPVGEASLVVAAAAPHRREAFEACAFAVDEIKKQAPIWKVEYEEAGAPG